ncbi:MAG: glutaredoxin family protein [Chromatiaceae bacterium]|nr:glutaredoxin family protein [Chromatiaceae bacterium]
MSSTVGGRRSVGNCSHAGAWEPAVKNTTRLVLLCVVLLSMLTDADAGIYRWVDANGRVQFSDQPPPTVEAESVELSPINTYEGVSVEELEESQAMRSQEPNPGKSRKVVMYSAPWCGVCKQAKRFFKAEGIRYRDLDIEQSGAARREWERMNATGVPVILVGNKRMNGFSEARFMELYRN